MIAIVSKQAEYALAALIELARNEGGQPLQAREIAARHGAPPATLEQVMVRLRRHGFLRSRRGAAGGYELAIPAEELTVADVLAAFLPRRSSDGAAAPPAPRTAIECVRRIEGAFANAAAETTIARLARAARELDEAAAYMPGL